MSTGSERRPSTNRIERAGPADLMFAALQRGAVPHQFGAIVVLQPRARLDAAVVADTLADRICAVPRLRQRLTKVPWGCGRPIWVDDPAFNIQEHIDVVGCPRPGDESAMLDVAARLLMHRLPMQRPPWHATVVTGLPSGRIALILVVQHALADGIGGLAVLSWLVDDAPPGPRRDFPQPPPALRSIAADAILGRLRVLTDAPRRIRTAVRTLDSVTDPRIGRAAVCSLLAATGNQRRLAVARARVEGLHDVAHNHDATINDVVLSAIGGALGSWLRQRGECVGSIVVGIPVGVRRTLAVRDLGNRLAQIRAAIPTAGERFRRLERVAQVTRAGKQKAWRLPAVAAVVRALAAVGIYDRYMRRQRYLHTVVTDLAGPTQPMTFCSAAITDVLPISVGGGGNVVVTFAALSYAGELVITLTADPDAMPDVGALAADLQAELVSVVTDLTASADEHSVDRR